MAKQRALLRNRELCQSASALQLRRKPKFEPLPLPALKTLWANGLARGIIAEIHGPRSSGRTSVCLHILAEATTHGEICAFVDLYDAFDPVSAAHAGVQLERLLWVRCQGNLEHAIRTADLLLHAGGFGIVVLDICEATPRLLNRIPLSYWYRFRRAIEHTPTVLLLCGNLPQAKSSISNRIRLKMKVLHWRGMPVFPLLGGFTSQAVINTDPSARPEPLSIELAG